jgi:hypothetical protein
MEKGLHYFFLFNGKRVFFTYYCSMESGSSLLILVKRKRVFFYLFLFNGKRVFFTYSFLMERDSSLVILVYNGDRSSFLLFSGKTVFCMGLIAVPCRHLNTLYFDALGLPPCHFVILWDEFLVLFLYFFKRS